MLSRSCIYPSEGRVHVFPLAGGGRVGQR
ncbi:Hypothetical protein, putative, partial [Bodo saltans]